MNEVLENIIPWMELVENVIFDESVSPNSFEENFCDGNEVIGVWFSSATMRVDFFSTSGAILTTTYTIKELDDWLEGEDNDHI